MRGYPTTAFYAAGLSPAPQHFASRQAPPLPRRLRAEPKINGRPSDARLDKPRVALKAQVLQKALPPPLPWLAHLCLLIGMANVIFARLAAQLNTATLCLFSHLNLVLSGFAHHKSDFGWSTFGCVHWSVVGEVAPPVPPGPG